MYLETLDRRSVSSGRCLQRFPFTEKRPARTPPSTFLFLPIHFSNSPGPMADPLPGEPESRRSVRLPTWDRKPDHFKSVRCFGGAPSRPEGRAAHRRPVYSLGPSVMSTRKAEKSPPKQSHFRYLPPAGCAALKPHSSVFLCVRGENVAAAGALKPSSVVIFDKLLHLNSAYLAGRNDGGRRSWSRSGAAPIVWEATPIRSISAMSRRFPLTAAPAVSSTAAASRHNGFPERS